MLSEITTNCVAPLHPNIRKKRKVVAPVLLYSDNNSLLLVSIDSTLEKSGSRDHSKLAALLELDQTLAPFV